MVGSYDVIKPNGCDIRIVKEEQELKLQNIAKTLIENKNAKIFKS